MEPKRQARVGPGSIFAIDIVEPSRYTSYMTLNNREQRLGYNRQMHDPIATRGSPG